MIHCIPFQYIFASISIPSYMVLVFFYCNQHTCMYISLVVMPLLYCPSHMHIRCLYAFIPGSGPCITSLLWPWVDCICQPGLSPNWASFGAFGFKVISPLSYLIWCRIPFSFSHMWVVLTIAWLDRAPNYLGFLLADLLPLGVWLIPWKSFMFI